MKKQSIELNRVKNDYHRDMIVPVSAFVTFESEEGVQRCLALSQQKYHHIKVLGEHPIAKKAPEPTNIIWENRETTRVSRFFRVLLVGLILFIMLALMFSSIVSLKRRALEANSKYLK